MATNNATDVFKFMTLRSAKPGSDEDSHRLYVKDDELTFSGMACDIVYYRKPRNPQGAALKYVFLKISCGESKETN